jgi:hypothetical protein
LVNEVFGIKMAKNFREYFCEQVFHYVETREKRGVRFRKMTKEEIQYDFAKDLVDWMYEKYIKKHMFLNQKINWLLHTNHILNHYIFFSPKNQKDLTEYNFIWDFVKEILEEEQFKVHLENNKTRIRISL